MLAWRYSRNGPFTVGVVAADHPTATRLLTLPGSGQTAGYVAWSVDGRSLLYWRVNRLRTAHGVSVPLYDLVQWRLPSGPATTIVAAVPTAWTEGVAPAIVPNPRGTLFASLLGEPGRLDQVVLYRRGGQRPRHIGLPGEPRQVAFAPSGTTFAVVWSPEYPRANIWHGALVATRTGGVQELGPAVAAFWLHAP